MFETKVSLWKRIRRSPYQAVGSIFTIFITIFVMLLFFLIATGSSTLLSYLESKPQLTVFFKDEKDQGSVDRLIDRLKSTGKISTVNFISKEKALAIYREQNKNDPLLLEMVTADILPSSLEVSATSPQHLSSLADIMRDEPGIDEVVYQKDEIETLIAWTSIARKIGLIFIVFLIISTLFIILTSISMKIALKREEIEILKLVGATPWYIKRPFVREGLVYGLIGGNIAWLVNLLILLYLTPYLNSFLVGLPALSLLRLGTVSVDVWPPNVYLFILMWVMVTLFGLGMGFLGSILATARFLKSN